MNYLYYMGERARTAHETEENVMGELFNEEEVDFGSDEATVTKITLQQHGGRGEGRHHRTSS